MQQAELPQAPCAHHSESAGAAWWAAMETGDFPRAWAASDTVLSLRPRGERDDPALPYHLRWVWNGTPVDGRRVLVRCYHGFGDTLQFCRYLPALRERAAHVTLEVQPELIPLMRLIGGIDRIAPFNPANPLPPAECDVEIMELAHALRIAPEPRPYLPLPRSRGPGWRAGLCWRVESVWRPQRSMPDEAAAVIATVGGVSFQSLQRGRPRPGLSDCPDALAETARVVARLDLVITIDTMVAHLAGAIGVPVWLLLDAEPDWRWLAGGRESPWYQGVRKYRQAVPGDWSAPVRAAAADLDRLARTGTVDR